MASITIFTPTYNRAHTLPKLYESLTRQTSENFCWLVIDDGSRDGTAALIRQWMDEGIIAIQYLYKDNGGMHTGHNVALENIDTELNMCIDSDDYLTDTAVEEILHCWDTQRNERYSGIIALDGTPEGEILGTPMPPGVTSTTLFALFTHYRARGDKKLIFRTDLRRRYPYPTFPGERFVPLGCKYLQLDAEYEMLLMNRIVCVVNYQPDSSTNNMFRQYLKNPRGFAYDRKISMASTLPGIRYKFRQVIHYVASSLIARDRGFIGASPQRALTVMALPFGILLYYYIRYRNRQAS